MMPSVAILAGGYATRLYPVTKTIPKAMLEVAGKPFIAHQLTLLKKNDITRVVICSGYLSRQIEDFIGNGSDFGLSVIYSLDGKKLLGTGGALKKALPILGDKFFVIYGDSYPDVDYNLVHKFFLSQNKKGLMTVFRNRDRWDKSNIVFKQGKIVNYDKEKKTRDMEYIDYGLSLLSRTVFDGFGKEDVFDISYLYKSLIKQGQMTGYEVKNRFYEIGSPQGLEETEHYLSTLSKK